MIDLQPILDSTRAVQIHVATVVPAFVLGTLQWILPGKGSALHKALGWAFMILMTITATVAIFIHAAPGLPTLAGFSPIHLFVPLTYWGVVRGVMHARAGRVSAHRNTMIGLYGGALLVAGFFAFMPGRIMHAVLFG